MKGAGSRSMHSPIIVFEGEDVRIYEFASQAESYLEIVDVEDGALEAFDGNGFLLDIRISKSPVERRLFWRRWIEHVPGIVIALHQPLADFSDAVRVRLMRCLKSREPLDFLWDRRPDPQSIYSLSVRELALLAGRRMAWKVEPPTSRGS